MGVVPNEPSMEDILSSIKRIIADGSDRTAAATRGPRRRGSNRDEGEESDLDMAVEDQDPAILELTDMVEEPVPVEQIEAEQVAAAPAGLDESAPEPTTTRKGNAKGASRISAAIASDTPPVDGQILSDVSAQAARQSLSQLSSLLMRPQEGESNTLEGLVREMLRPMLKDWLEAQLPELVESLVKKEIDRIVGRLG